MELWAVLVISKIYGSFWSGPFWPMGRFGRFPYQLYHLAWYRTAFPSVLEFFMKRITFVFVCVFIHTFICLLIRVTDFLVSLIVLRDYTVSV